MLKQNKSLIYGECLSVSYNIEIKEYTIKFLEYTIRIYLYNYHRYTNKEIISICDAYYIDNKIPFSIYCDDDKNNIILIFYT